MGTPYGAIQLTAGMSIPHHANYNFGIRDWSVDLAFKTSSNGPLAHKFASNVGWKIETTGNKLRFTFNTASYTTTDSVTDNEWHKVHCSIDRSSETIYIILDGTLLTQLDIANQPSVSNSATLYLGSNGSTHLTCSVSAFRLSNRVRHTENYFDDRIQLFDDSYTVALFLFNEGYTATTTHDSSTTRNHATSLTGQSFVFGPDAVNPVTVVRDRIWLALDNSSDLTRFLNARLVRNSFESSDQVHDGKYRFRQGDYVPPSYTPQNTPALIVAPAALPDIKEGTTAYHVVMVPFSIEGHLFAPHVGEIEMFWWLCLRAVFAAYKSDTTVGRFNFCEIQHMVDRGPSWEVQEQNDKSLYGKFEDSLLFTVHHDFLP